MKTRIKEYRARTGMTQADLADAVGVRRETIVFLEKGTYNPSLKLAHDVARSAWHEDRYSVSFSRMTLMSSLRNNPGQRVVIDHVRTMK